MKLTSRIAIGMAVGALFVSGCSVQVYEEGSQAGGGGGGGGGGDGTETGAGAGGQAVNQDPNTGAVSIAGANTGAEADAIQGVIDEHVTPDSEYTATYTGSDGFEQNVIIQIEGGTPPDIANFPQPGAVIEQAQQGNAVALEDMGFNIADLEARFGEYLMSLGEYDGKHYGIPTDVNFKSAVWYNVPAFEEAGYEPAETWEELIALSDQIVADGSEAWCIGTGSDAATGWPATDWMEDIVLRSAGTEAYDQWVAGELEFSSDEIRSAAERFGEILFTEGYVFGGHDNISATDFRDAPDPMFQDDPPCYLHRQASFITNFFPEGLTPIEDYDYFKFPTIDGNDGVLMAGGMAAVFNNRAEVRDFLDAYTTGEAQCTLGSFEGVALISPNVETDASCYQNELIAQMAGDLLDALQAGNARFDASDLMPPEVGSGSFWTGMNNYTDDGPDNLDEVLQTIDQGWPSS